MMNEDKLQYKVWHFPEVWPESVEPHWKLVMQTNSLEAAFLKKVELTQSPDGDVMITQLINVEVAVVTPNHNQLKGEI